MLKMINYSMMIITFSMILFITALSMMNMNMFISFNIPLINMLSYNISLDLMLDWISLLFLSTVLFISSMILMFSMYYINKKEHKQFSLLLIMFISSMTILILSNNIFLMLVGWDGLGLSSYILVIYYQNFQTAASGSITLMSNRIGDILILMSMALLMTIKTWNFSMNSYYFFTIMLLLTMAALSKSAQFPFSAWLPMAMAAPTPISALVHSSTLVTAGVFMLLRIMNNIHPYTMFMLMIISSATALYASMTANWEQDLKKIIALSTLSQIAMMMFAISINSINLAFMHLIIHALFKSTMFMCAGVMIHESSYQDMRMMGMSMLMIPLTSSVMGITSMSLMGIPFMSGFFSKDAIIEMLISSNMKSVLTTMMIMSIGLTISYSIRMLTLSNKFLFKSKSLISNHHSNMYNIPIIIMSMTIIVSGTTMLWSYIPEQMLLFPNTFKFMIIMMLIISFLLGMSLSFKKKIFLLLGFSSISLWFNHSTSTFPMILSSPMMSIYMNDDKMWKEEYGPKELYNYNMILSKIPNLTKMSYLMIIILISLPIIIIM